MKKVNKSLPPNVLTSYAQTHPQNSWDDFYYHQKSDDYKQLKTMMLDEQGDLCAYCEKELAKLSPSQQRVEHYHSKSDTSNPSKNWALDWHNIFVVCLGGSESKQRHPLPANLSCDAHKAYLIDKKKLPEACEGYFLNPLTISVECLFGFNKGTGELTVNQQACKKLENIDNRYNDIETLLQKTIEILNLNCDRLKEDRLEVLKMFNQELSKARKSNDKNVHTKLAKRWFGNRWPSFFTTRRILLGIHAEQYLASIAYTG